MTASAVSTHVLARKEALHSSRLGIYLFIYALDSTTRYPQDTKPDMAPSIDYARGSEIKLI